jgi:hypothetical protein
MATRSTIALEFADGTVQQVYCHWDGYLEHNGKILKEHYSDPFKLRDLIDLGSISSLQQDIGEKHAFSHFDTEMTQDEYYEKFGKMTTFYARERGEELRVNKFKDLKDYYENFYGEEYDYILSPRDGKPQWYVRYHATEGNWIPIEHAFEQYAIAEEN